jgi:hypothetical protein
MAQVVELPASKVRSPAVKLQYHKKKKKNHKFTGYKNN